MAKILRQELFKLTHRKLTWWILALLLLFMVFIGIAMRNDYSRLLMMTCYDSSDIIMLILVIVGSTIFSTEFQNKTILNLLYHAPNRTVVFIAKFLALFIYDVFLHLLAMLLTIIFSWTPLLKYPVSWLAIYQHHQPLWVNMIANAGVDLVTSTLIISLICLTSCLINSNAWVVVVNAIIIFMGSDFSSQLILAKIAPARILRWNPLNMLNLTSQYYNYASYHPASMLANNQLLCGSIIYIIIFTFCGYFVFASKRF